MILRFLYYEVLLFLILRLVFEIMFKFTYILFLILVTSLYLRSMFFIYFFTHATFNLRSVFDGTLIIFHLFYHSCSFF